jgi:alpha-glucosidase
MLYALRGTPFVYQGEELGLPDAEIPPERVVDVDGRDPERAPIPWAPPSQAGPGAGFTTGEPWLPLVAEAEALNVARQAADPDSTLSLARRLAWLRRAEPVLVGGEQRTIDAGPDLLAWLRLDGDGDGATLLAVVNFAAQERRLRPPRDLPARGAVVLSSDPARAAGDVALDALALAPAEAVLVRIG